MWKLYVVGWQTSLLSVAKDPPRKSIYPFLKRNYEPSIISMPSTLQTPNQVKFIMNIKTIDKICNTIPSTWLKSRLPSPVQAMKPLSRVSQLREGKTLSLGVTAPITFCPPLLPSSLPAPLVIDSILIYYRCKS